MLLLTFTSESSERGLMLSQENLLLLLAQRNLFFEVVIFSPDFFNEVVVRHFAEIN